MATRTIKRSSSTSLSERLRPPPTPRLAKKFVALSLFWRTFFLLALLLASGVFAWVQTFRALEFEPRAIQAAQQIASLVNIARAALLGTDGINRIAIIKSVSTLESVKLTPREPTDKWEPFEVDRFQRVIERELRDQLGPDTIVASSMNGTPGLWVGFSIARDSFWLKVDPTRVGPMSTSTIVLWVSIALLATVLGSAGDRAPDQPAAQGPLVRRQPHPRGRVRLAPRRDDDDERDPPGQHGLQPDGARARQGRAGPRRHARRHLARPAHAALAPAPRGRDERRRTTRPRPTWRWTSTSSTRSSTSSWTTRGRARSSSCRCDVATIVAREAAAFRDTSQIRIQSKVAPDTRVLADDVELGRVLQNLFENARRYGRSTDTGIARVVVSYARTGPWVIITVRDHGQGVDPKKLDQLTTPFFRGDAARTAATGAGLGLAIVEKALQRMGGAFELANATEGGLLAHIRLKRA